MALAVVSATDASACSRRVRACGAYAPAPVYQYAPPPPQVYYAPPPAAYYAPPVPAGYGYAAYGRPDYGYAPAAGYYGYGYRNCDRGRGYGYANGYGYGYGPPPAAYDDYRPAAVWAPFR
jgi:hypothetical protein